MKGGASGFLIALLFVQLANAAGSAPEGIKPETLTRLSRSVVKVRSGDDWQTGFVFGSPRHVVTCHHVANESSDLKVVGPDQKTHAVRVVAWSEKDDLALLELDEIVSATPLQASKEGPWTPEPIFVLYEPTEPDPDSKVANAWNVPVVMSGHVARVFADEIDIDVALWGRPGDCGAPVVTESSQVIGVVSHKSSKQRRMLATRVERAKALFAQRGKQREFSRSSPWRGFGGLFVSPTEAKGLVGAGLDLGVAYKWFALELAEGVYQSGYRPLNSRQFEQTDRFQIEVAAEVQISLGETGKLFIGPAARLRLDWVETQSIAASGELVKETRGEARVRPAVFFGFASGLFFVRGSYWDDPRMDFGLVWGR